MAKVKTVTPEERKWELNKFEVEFEKLLSQSGYAIIGVREYIGKTEYDLQKDGVAIDWALQNLPKINVKGVFKSLENAFDTKKQLEELRAEINK